jgi:hypothetical protein
MTLMNIKQKYITGTKIFLSSVSCVFLLSLDLSAQSLEPAEIDERNGRELMEQVNERHQQFPYIYEEQSIVMVDRNGYRDTRKAKRYSRVEEDGTVRFLVVFDSPREVKGVALLAKRDPDGSFNKSVYLPALGEQLIESSEGGDDANFLGTDFSVENITGEKLDNYRYERRPNTRMDNTDYYVVDVYKPHHDPDLIPALRRHYIRMDNYYITQSDHFDRQGKVYKKQTHHDLKPLDGDMWRASMILMEDKKEKHQSLIKIDRRVFSHDYVPETIFTAEWLFENYPDINRADDSDSLEDDIGMEESEADNSDEMISSAEVSAP